MNQLFYHFFSNALSFIVIMSIIVFLHEFGHFIVARLCGVRVLEFSIGFGKKIWSRTDKKQTQWQLRLLPFGGFVRMYGDRNAVSSPQENITATDAFINKNVYQKIAIVIAGPVANFLSAIVIFSTLFYINGFNRSSTVIETVVAEMPASIAGMQKDDKILAINGKEMQDFDDVANFIAISLDKTLDFRVQRQEQIININIEPKTIESKNFFGELQQKRVIGIASGQIEHVNLSFGQSIIKGITETYNTSATILTAVKQLVSGQRSVKEINGPVKIAKYSGKTVEYGFIVVLWFVALVSINLGIMNLLPIPALDGGHLFYYILEIIFRRPIPIKVQDFGNRIGLSFLVFIMLIATYNDIFGLFK
jgi:regulator of sigma E protease